MTEQMKESGIQWIGAIPYNWNVERIKHIIQCNDNGIKVGPFGSALTNEVVSSDEGKYKVYGQSNLIRKDFSYGDNYVSEQNYKRLINYEVLPNDIAVSMMGTIGKCSVVPDNIEPGIMDSHLIKIRLSPKMLPRYFEYAYESDMGYSQLLINSKGSIMNGLNSTIVKGLYIPVPEIIEQQAIADYLDKECAQIDSIAADLEKQIELLQQYKKSLITEAVTKGLDKSVPMKDSGVEWIGKIPEHWDVLRVKDISKLQTGTTPPGNEGVNFDNDGIQWFTPADFNDGSIKLGLAEKSIDFATIHRENIKAYPANTVLFVGIASIGKIGFSTNTCYSNQQTTGIKPNNDKNGKYIAYSLLAGMDGIKDNALYTTVPIINNAYLGNIKIPFPPANEQETITKYLDYATSSVDEIIGKKLEQLSTIRQHKNSLIYEYVTGKKRVKEVQ